ncbi:MAG: hypothetical protein PUD79_04565 [Prevotellaceae bacterium]|nr:hypothetical protein [Prevotellaceae bacterium]
MARRIGIDFGTSTTVVRYCNDGDNETKEIIDSNGNKIIPTAVYKSANGYYAYGHEAISAYINDHAFVFNQEEPQGQLFINFKMDLLQPKNSPERKQAEDLILKFFKEHIYKLVKNQIPDLEYEPYELAFSFPAKWKHSMNDAMADIIKEAGFRPLNEPIRQNEPNAAMFNMLHNHKRSLVESKLLQVDKPLHVFMLDMGAGTSDITIFRFLVKNDGEYTLDHMLPYPPVDNPCLNGGREIDQLLYDYVHQYCRKYNVILEEGDFEELSAKKWKDGFMSNALKLDNKSNLPDDFVKLLRCKSGGHDVNKSFYFDRAVFESLTQQHWRNLYGLICSAIKKYQSLYGIGAKDIDLLCLTGGHSKWYTVQKLFNGEGVFGSIGKIKDDDNNNSVSNVKFEKLIKEPYRIERFLDPKPQESVANGLCYIDDTIEICPSAANNIWMQLVINDKESEVIEVVTQGMVLPCEKEVSVNLGLIQTDYQVKLNNDFRGYFKVFTGEILNKDIFDKIDISLNLGLIEFFFGGNKYDVTSTSKIIIDDGKPINISGEVIFIGQDGFYHPRKVVSFKN